MRVLAISEHFSPRVGGTVEYVRQTCESLQALGHDVQLLVPTDCSSRATPSNTSYRVAKLEVGWPDEGDPDRQTRYRFCQAVNEYVRRAVVHGEVDVVHVLFGLFINETLNTESISMAGVPCVTTIHNVPPQECGRSWPGDRFIARVRDRIRLNVVASKNRGRLRDHKYDVWVVPSEIVGRLLGEVVDGERIEVVPHGCSTDLLGAVNLPPSRGVTVGEKLRLLTVGGWVPHKRQHLIPKVGSQLLANGIDFVWDLAGPPNRVPRYRDAIIANIAERGLEHCVLPRGSVSGEELAHLYTAANLYVQPSTEEGFCITALDAAAVGLPVIGCPAGALPEICKISGGALVPSHPEDLALAIEHFYRAQLWPAESRAVASIVQGTYTWRSAAERLSDLYADARKNAIELLGV